jgi:pimeloyl-ACP methyl ester carboxylesterase
MPTARINGINIHYQRSGRGPDIVLIHGLAANLAFWYFRILPALIKDFRVTIYDLRGHGKSDMPASGYTSAEMAFDLHALMDHLGVTKAHLVGHSFGGGIGLHYASLHPDRVLSLTLADARVHALQPVQRLKDWSDRRVVENALERIGVSIAEDETEAGHRLLEEFANLRWSGSVNLPTGGADFFLPFWSGLRGKRAARRWLYLFHKTNVRKELTSVSGLTRDKIRQIRLPVLAIYGEKSRCLRTLRGLQRSLPNCQTIIIPGADHFYPIVVPRVFVQNLREFLSDSALREDGVRR